MCPHLFECLSYKLHIYSVIKSIKYMARAASSAQMFSLCIFLIIMLFVLRCRFARCSTRNTSVSSRARTRTTSVLSPWWLEFFSSPLSSFTIRRIHLKLRASNVHIENWALYLFIINGEVIVRQIVTCCGNREFVFVWEYNGVWGMKIKMFFFNCFFFHVSCIHFVIEGMTRDIVGSLYSLPPRY